MLIKIRRYHNLTQLHEHGEHDLDSYKCTFSELKVAAHDDL